LCGIVGIFDFEDMTEMRSRAMAMARTIRHRGPDWSGIYADEKAILAHERLSIVDVEHGAQPLVDKSNGNVLAVNGEIYNHTELRSELNREHKWQTKSDCEVLLYLYEEYGPAFIDKLNGIFAFALYDKAKGSYLVARDHIGIEPLYIGWDGNGVVHIASEMKALDKYCDKLQEFPPGHYYDSKDGRFVKWYERRWMTEIPSAKADLLELRRQFEAAVHRQLMSDVPYGVLISGGLDSSLVAFAAYKYSRQRVESGDSEEAWWPRLHSFSVGLEGSPDMAYARQVAARIGTVHHEIIFTIQEGIDALRDVIWHLETFDTTTIRAATPMYLMARKIKSMGIKMVLSGEGSDELFGGYLYFHKAPNAREFHEELVEKVGNLSKYDCLRANKSTAAWGLETRVPFLDKIFVDYVMGISPEEKMCKDSMGRPRIEKDLLRRSFEGVFPDSSVLWRQKEQFSDGVGYGWIDQLKKFTEAHVTDKMMASAAERFPVQVPTSKEQYYYRTIFDELFHSRSAASTVPVGPSVACSTPRAMRWSEDFAKMVDPSGRAVRGVHKQSV
jgi:asparagine synthase (glutamine-hydrolysing)